MSRTIRVSHAAMTHRVALAVLCLSACTTSTLQDQLTSGRDTPDGYTYDHKLPKDPARTGVFLSPPVDHVIAPSRLLVVNRSGLDLRCEIYEDTQYCPSLGEAWDPLITLEAGERFELFDVDCLVVDIACLPADADDQTPPVRTWTWFIEPDDGG